MARLEARVLLRREKDAAYLQDNGKWTPARGTARTFQNCSEAVFYATMNGLSRVQVLVAFEPDHYYDLVAMRL